MSVCRVKSAEKVEISQKDDGAGGIHLFRRLHLSDFMKKSP